MVCQTKQKQLILIILSAWDHHICLLNTQLLKMWFTWFLLWFVRSDKLFDFPFPKGSLNLKFFIWQFIYSACVTIYFFSMCLWSLQKPNYPEKNVHGDDESVSYYSLDLKQSQKPDPRLYFHHIPSSSSFCAQNTFLLCSCNCILYLIIHNLQHYMHWLNMPPANGIKSTYRNGSYWTCNWTRFTYVTNAMECINYCI